MRVLFNTEKLLRLIGALQTFTGIKTCIFDAGGRDIQIFGGHQEFCRLINADPEGHRRCENCDARAVEACAASGGLYRYRCHLGLCEAALPLVENGVPIAYLSFGQYLDNSPKERQWERTEKAAAWFTGDKKALREAFWQLRQYSFQETSAYADILQALSAYILREGIIRSAEYTDGQRLELYLDQHYRENLSLKRIAGDLHMGTTKLCALAKSLPGGGTVGQAIARRRIREACAMLRYGDAPVSAVAEAVGYSDYNYFTKVFRAAMGMTPSAYRKANRQ